MVFLRLAVSLSDVPLLWLALFLIGCIHMGLVVPEGTND